MEEILCIIDHANHKAYIEYVSEEELAKYDGEEEDYIKDKYDFDGDFSWDWVVSFDVNKNKK